MRGFQRNTLLVISGSLAAIYLGAFQATGAESRGQDRQCIPLSFIDQSPVIDDRTILVKMRGGGGYKRIDLRSRCPGLIFSGFARQSQSNEFCASDTLQVLTPENTTCFIEKIVTIDKAEADRLQKK